MRRSSRVIATVFVLLVLAPVAASAGVGPFAHRQPPASARSASVLPDAMLRDSWRLEPGPRTTLAPGLDYQLDELRRAHARGGLPAAVAQWRVQDLRFSGRSVQVEVLIATGDGGWVWQSPLRQGNREEETPWTRSSCSITRC